MVVFTCHYCGASLQKPKVDKHYRTNCRHRTPSVTCVDCLKDFVGEEYGNHTQCVSEAERYAADGTVFKESVGKNKQARYCEIIQNLLHSRDLTPVHMQLLSICSNHENVPRKQKKFNNFMNNVARQVKYNDYDLKSVFDILESAWKNEMKSNIASNGNQNLPGTKLPVNAGEMYNKLIKTQHKQPVDDDYQIESKNVPSTYQAAMEYFKENGATKHKTKNIEKYNNKSLQSSVKTQENSNLTIEKEVITKQLEQTQNVITSKRKPEDCYLFKKKKRKCSISKFDWTEEILRVLHSRPDKELSIKRLEKKIIFEYESVNPAFKTYEDLLAKFNRKVKKITQLTFSNGKAKLIE